MSLAGIVAVLRGDSLQSRSELITEPTQGIYRKFVKKGGVDERRYCYDKCMPSLNAREAWGAIMPARITGAKSVEGLWRAMKA